MPLEEERKYQVEPQFELPDLTGQLPEGGQLAAADPVTLTATYFDTADRRLSRAGVSLRYRRGDPQPWTVKLPADTPGVRREITRPGRPGDPPAELLSLISAYTRGRALEPAAVLRSRRHRLRLCDRDGTVLAEIADDTVAVLDGRRVTAQFREIEVERVAGGRKLLDRIEEQLRAAGARSEQFTPKVVRALGPAAAAPPDLPPPAPLDVKPRAGDVVTGAIRRTVAKIVAHDPLVRLRGEVPDRDTPVHQMRVAVRRLRSDLRTFDLLVDSRWARELRRELRWLAEVLGRARDVEVLRARLVRTASADPLAPLDGSAVARIDTELAARHGEALDALDEALASRRYLALLDALVDAAAGPRLSTLAATSAREVLPRLVANPWRTLAYGSRGVQGAVDLAEQAGDDEWHAVRISGKRARYAVDAVAAVVGGKAPALARALARVQDLLGEHQDAAVAGQTWLEVARSEPDNHALAVTAGRLYERERAAIREARSAFPAAWRAASKRRTVAWLP